MNSIQNNNNIFQTLTNAFNSRKDQNQSKNADKSDFASLISGTPLDKINRLANFGINPNALDSGLYSGSGLLESLFSKSGLDAGIIRMPYMSGVNVQFDLNLSIMQQTSRANGYSMSSFEINFSGSLTALGYKGGDIKVPFANLFSNASSSTFDPIQALQEYFSPENTATRILDFTLGFFTKSSMFREGGDTEDARIKFADYIGAAIQKGFDQAIKSLPPLDEKTQAGVDTTHRIVFDGLDSFKQNGYTPTQSQDQLRKENLQFQFELTYTRVETQSTSFYSNSNPNTNINSEIDTKV